MDSNDLTAQFFAYARERHAIYLRREMGLPRADWTEDRILKEYRFCNVFRELDTTTIWLREHVREPLRDKPEVLLAVVLYRWFNRIRTGEAVFLQGFLDDGRSAWEKFLDDSDTAVLKESILAYCGKGPYVTGSYIIKTPDGIPKLPGVLLCLRRFMKNTPVYPRMQPPADWQTVARNLLSPYTRGFFSLESTWEWLRNHDHLGDFMSYEVVSDLRYTDMLDKAPDIMTWANPGPGAMRGLNRIHGRDLKKLIPKKDYIVEMQKLLEVSKSPIYCPQWSGSEWEFDGEMPRDMDRHDPTAWPTWDMRTVEHTLCEFDKYLRVKNGEGAPRQKYKGA